MSVVFRASLGIHAANERRTVMFMIAFGITCLLVGILFGALIERHMSAKRNEMLGRANR